MRLRTAIGFIGFGEAGWCIARGLRDAGSERLYGFDVAAHSHDRGGLIRERAQQSGTTLVESAEALIRASDIVFSAVTASSACGAALQATPYLKPRHFFVDLNSVSPATKREVAGTLAVSGAAFVEAAIMAPVIPYGHRVPMLLGGPATNRFIDRMRPYGMRLEPIPGGQVGTAAAIKMCRSIVVKGLEALLCECILGAAEYAATEHVFASLQETCPGLDWRALADNAMNRVVVHGERRAREMDEVVATLEAVGVAPQMATATARRQEWGASLGLVNHFGAKGPARYADVIEVLANRAAATRIA